jgi:hypothetical protein
MPVRDPEVTEMPGEICAELIAVVGLHALDGHGEPLAHLIHEGDRVRNGIVRVDPEDPVAGGLIDRGELIEASAPELEMLDVDLDRLAGHREVPAPARPRSVALHRHPGHPVSLEDLIDGRDRDIDLMKSLEIEANADGPVLALGTDAEDEGDDVGRCGEVGPPRARLEVLKPFETLLAIPMQPGIELASGDPKESAGLTHIVRDLLEMLNPPEPRLGLPEFLVLDRRLSHDRPPRSRLEGVQGKGY